MSEWPINRTKTNGERMLRKAGIGVGRGLIFCMKCYVAAHIFMRVFNDGY